MKKKTKTLILSIVITLVLLLTFTVTYALFTYNETGTSNNKLILGDIYMYYNETTNVIDIDDMMPMSEITLNTSDDAVNTCVNYLYTTYGGEWNGFEYDGIEFQNNFNNNNTASFTGMEFMTELGKPSYEEYCSNTYPPGDYEEIYGNRILEDFENGILTEADKKYFLENNIIIDNVANLDYFEFKISGKNTYPEKDIWYEILLNHGETSEGKVESSRIKDYFLRFRLTKVNDNNTEEVLLSNIGYANLSNQKIYVETIPQNTMREISNTYRLYMWIDESVVIGNYNQDYTMEEWNDAFASIKVNVLGDFIERKFAYEDIYNVTDASCFTFITTGTYTVNPNMTEDEINKCSAFFTNLGVPEGADVESFCKGEGPIDDMTFQGFVEFSLSNGSIQMLQPLINDNVILLDANGVEITDYDTSCGSDVVIPKIINGNNVIGISSKCVTTNQISNKFGEISADGLVAKSNGTYSIKPVAAVVCGLGNKNLTSVVIPNTVKNIDFHAFSGNQLTSVIFEEGSKLSVIGDSAFENNQLKTITIESDIDYMGEAIFASNLNLETITFTNKTCNEIKNIKASNTSPNKYFPWLYIYSPFYQDDDKVSIFGIDGECEYK